MRKLPGSALALAFALIAPVAAEEKPDLGPLIDLLAGGVDPAARMDAAKRLGLSGDAWAAEPLIRALRDEERPVRWAAIEALGDLRDPSAAPALLDYLKKKEAYRWGKFLTVNALAAIKDPAAEEPLLALAHDEDPILKRLAVMALAKMGDDRVFPVALDLLEDESPWLRRTAQAALVQLAGRRIPGEPPRGYEAWARWHEDHVKPGAGAADGVKK